MHRSISLPDVVKALCLGAKAVGLGRAFLYAQSVRPMSLNSNLTLKLAVRPMERPGLQRLCN